MINYFLNNHIMILSGVVVLFYLSDYVYLLKTTRLTDSNIMKRYTILTARRNGNKLPEVIYGEWTKYTIKD